MMFGARRVFCLAATVTSLAVTRQASALNYSTEAMTSWSGCDADCAPNIPLNYTDDQINLFRAQMNALGHANTHHFTNGNVWASDLVEDNFGGEDYLYTDDVPLYAYSGHGGEGRFAGITQTYELPACHAGTYGSCVFSSQHSRFGEFFSSAATPNRGWMRWAIFATCNSVDHSPNEQWDQTFWYGGDYVHGYRGISADSTYTSEALEDWASAAMGDGDTFKSAWFWAIEDWYVDDVGSVLAPGYDATDATVRMNEMWRGHIGRTSTLEFNAQAWSWHEG